MSVESGSPEAEFIQHQLLRYFDSMKGTLGRFYFDDDDERERFYGFIHPNFEENSAREKGAIIPTISYTSRVNGFVVTLEPESILSAAEDLAERSHTSSGDIAKLLIGAGVARGLIGWKTFPIQSNDNDLRRFDIQEILHDKEALFQIAEQIDPENEADITSSIARMGDSEILRLNSLRYAVGISLQHFTDALALQQSVAEIVKPELFADQVQRSLDLKVAMAIMDNIQGAFDFYDDTVNHVLFALAFPASPAEVAALLTGQKSE